MTAPVPTAIALAHELILEVDTSSTEAPTWQKVRFASSIDPQIVPAVTDATTYDDEGTVNNVRTGETWTVAFTINRYRDATGAFLPEAELLRKAADPGIRGEAAKVHVRWYDKRGADEAYEGHATVTWKRANTAAKDLGTATVTLTGSGALTAVATPVTP